MSDCSDLTAPFWGFAGSGAALIFSCIGAAYGTAKAGAGVAGSGVANPNLVMKNIIPVVMASVLAIYGLIIAVIVGTTVGQPCGTSNYSLYKGYAQFAGGLAVGLSSMAAGFAIGIAGDAGVRAVVLQPRLFVAMILILIFAEALGLYGLIVALIVAMK